MRTTQDDGRENKQIKLFGLTAAKGRSNKYTSDASWTHNGKKYMVELKSCDAVKGHVSTSREFGIDKIEAWKTNDGFVFSRFEKTERGIKFTKHVHCTHEQLRPFFDKQIEKQNKGTARRGAGLDVWPRIRGMLEECFAPDEVAKIEKTYRRGTKLNDPKISWSKLEEWGTVLDAQDPRKHLRELLTQENK
tara:strand:- start:264 stop:836 length:573 start_codon:yes stop_codon:yes gene_type:complete